MFANLFVIYATSFDLLAGYTGLISFGHSLFFGGAGYLAGLLSLSFGLPLTVCIITGCLFALIVGLLLGYICLRLKGPYLAVVTLICPLVVITILYASPTILGGENGIAGFAQLAGGSLIKQFYIVLALTMVSLLIILVLARGNLGLILKTIREDELGAEAAGINTTKYKLIAFIVSGFFSGVSGTFYAHIMGSIGPTMLSLQYGMSPIFMIYLGGASSIIGPAIGAYVITFLDLYLLAFPYMRIIIYAAIIIIFLRFLPGGLMAVPSEIGRLKRWLS
jgi:branched-chain amino acid transport system permease protein